MPDQPTPSSTQPQVPSQTPPKQLPQKPVVSFNVLFVVGIIFAFLVILFSLFFMRSNWLRISILRPSSNYNRSFQDITSTPVNEIPTPTKPLNRIPGWEVYTSSAFSFSFQYPKEYRLEQGEKGTQLLEKVSIFNSNYQYPIFKVTVWDYPSGTLQRQDIEKWCFRTLLEEARKENLLCAFMSSAAIDEIEIDNVLVYTVSSYSSFGEKVEYYIIPQNGKTIIIQSVTLLNDQSLDNGKSKAKEILATFSLQ